MQHGRLARAVWSNEAERLAASHAKIELMQDFHLPVTGIQAVDAQMRLVAGKRIELFNFDIARNFKCLTHDLINGNNRPNIPLVTAGHLCLPGSRHQCTPRYASITFWSC